jgi:hypothetical protein
VYQPLPDMAADRACQDARCCRRSSTHRIAPSRGKVPTGRWSSAMAAGSGLGNPDDFTDAPGSEEASHS